MTYERGINGCDVSGSYHYDPALVVYGQSQHVFQVFALADGGIAINDTDLIGEQPFQHYESDGWMAGSHDDG